MKLLFVFSVLACAIMMSHQVKLDTDDLVARRLKLQMPTVICEPAKSAGTFIIQNAITCAYKMLPGTDVISKAVTTGKEAAGKMGAVEKIEAMADEATQFVIKKL